jgi:hypothetical protein
MTKRRVSFTEDGARRIVNAVRDHERGNANQPPVRFNRPVGGDDGGDPVRLGKTTATWTKGTTATINVWESGTPPSETQTTGVTITGCVNKFATVASGKWVIVARGGNGFWYLIAAEC